MKQAALELLDQSFVERIVAEALEVLEKVGVFLEHEEALALLGDAGAGIDKAAKQARIPEDLVRRCLRSAPSTVRLFDREGNPALALEGLNTHFDPGSAALNILDPRAAQPRPAVTADLVAFASLADALPNMSAQSTGLVPSDVPEEIADRYRLFIGLLHSSKPIVTGTFTAEGFAVMKEMLLAVAGGQQALRARPMAIFDACSSQPLKWSRLTTQSLLESARSGIPGELISAPMLGANSPVSLAGALVQHTAENLSGVVIHQLAGAGSPLVYGGSPAAFDMRYGTMALGAPETMMLCCAFAQIGRRLGLPTHAYLGLSDAKLVDAQAGLESGMGALTAVLSGINMVSGAGMLEFESCQSLVKMVIDDDACGMARRFAAGIQPRGERLAQDLFGDLSRGDHFFTSAGTLRWLREEVSYPSRVIDRASRQSSDARRDIIDRAQERIRGLMGQRRPKPLPEELRRHLTEIMSHDARRHGMGRLPLEG